MSYFSLLVLHGLSCEFIYPNTSIKGACIFSIEGLFDLEVLLARTVDPVKGCFVAHYTPALSYVYSIKGIKSTYVTIVFSSSLRAHRESVQTGAVGNKEYSVVYKFKVMYET